MIKIYSEVEKIVPRFWDGSVFHPTDAIEDDWGQRILEQLSRDKAVRVVRLYTMFEDMATLDEKGEIRYDFELNDQRLDTLLSLGFTPMVNYAFLPPWLCVHQDFSSSVAKAPLRYKGKRVVNSYAADPEKWGEICRVYTEHITERYGRRQVRGWILQCYNEPDIKPFFMAEAGPSNEPEAQMARLREYLKLYRAFAKAVKGVDPAYRIGNSLAGSLPFMEGFLKAVKEEGLPLDFMGIHTYATGPKGLNSGETPFDAMGNVKKYRALRELADRYIGKDLPCVCDEWGAASAGFFNVEECPQMIIREKSAHAAYFGKMITHYADEETRPEKVMICLSGQHEMTVDFSGFRNFFTLNFIRKPIYNAHVLANKLGAKMLRRSPDPENLTVYPTVDEKGRIAVLLSYAAPHFDKTLPARDLEITFEGFSGKAAGRLWRIDPHHTDPYAEYLRRGLTDPIPEKDLRDLREIGEPKAETFSCDLAQPLTLTLPCDGFALLELEPQA